MVGAETKYFDDVTPAVMIPARGILEHELLPARNTKDGVGQELADFVQGSQIELKPFASWLSLGSYGLDWIDDQNGDIG